MATNFPSSLDNFTNPVSGNTLDSPSHSLQHSDANDAIEAIEAKLGVGASPAGSATAGQVLTISAAGTSGWSTPTRDGLVQVIPTSVAVGSGSGSVDASGNVTFSGASSVSLNGCFSSTYKNYLVIVSDVTCSGTTTVDFKLRAGTDNSSSYYWGIALTNTLASSIPAGGTNVSSYRLFNGVTAVRGFCNLNINNPFDSSIVTLFNGSLTGEFSGNIAGGSSGGLHNVTGTAFDGFSVIGGSANLTGTIRVYGYRN